MKIDRNSPIASCLFLAAFVFSGNPAGASEGTSGDKATVMESVTVSAQKTHTLFMGADISVSLGGELYPVRDVVGGSWVLKIGGQEKLVSTTASSTNLDITPNLKLSEGSAAISGFSRTQSYSFSNDPGVIITKRLAKTGMTTAMLEGVSQDAQNYQDVMKNNGMGPSRVFAYSDKQFGAEANAILSNANFKSDATNGGKADAALKWARRQEAIAESNTKSETEQMGQATTLGFDALNVDFTISSAKPLYNPYVVSFTRYHPKKAKPGIVQNHIYAMALNPIGTNPLHVRLVEEGFSYDYEIVDFQLHVYDGGVEVATSMSANRVDLTRDEAFQYVKMEYMDKHHADTLPAVPAMGRLPSALPARLAAGDYSAPFFVRVSRDGLGQEAFADKDCTKRIGDDFLDSVVKDIRFKPALSNGRPVSGVAEMNLSKLEI